VTHGLIILREVVAERVTIAFICIVIEVRWRTVSDGLITEEEVFHELIVGFRVSPD
jgi:hypothetical protein